VLALNELSLNFNDFCHVAASSAYIKIIDLCKNFKWRCWNDLFMVYGLSVSDEIVLN
jgi:hypothetical protein